MTMIDLKPTIVARSDQQNADDYLGGPRTIRITKVALRDTAEQPIAIHFEGDDGKPYLPCKSMRRVMVNVWGDDGNAYIGRSLTLYRDGKVQFGGESVGGIRISHMSDIERDVVVPIMVTRGKRKPYTVHPLRPEQRDARPPTPDLAALRAAGHGAAGRGSIALQTWWKTLSKPEQAAAKATLDTDLKPLAVQADQAERGDQDTDFGDMPDGAALASLKTGAQVLAEKMAERGATEEPAAEFEQLPLGETLDEQVEAATPPTSDMDPLDWAASFTRALDGMDTAAEIDEALTAETNIARFAALKAKNGAVAAELNRAISARRVAIKGGR